MHSIILRDIKMKKVLIITYYWPPSGGPGVQRVLKFCKYLPEFGWEPTVLTVQNGEYPAIDQSFNHDISHIQVETAKGFSFFSIFKRLTGKSKIASHQMSAKKGESFISKLSRWVRIQLIIPDGRIGWYWSAVKKGKRMIVQNDYDLIFSSSPPHTVHLVAKALAKSSKLPWVADFRDPWTDRFYYQENKRNELITYFDSLLEKSVLKQANHISVVSSGFKELLHDKFPINQKSTLIYNGFDMDDFSSLALGDSKNETIKIGHIGSLSKTQNPTGLIQSIKLYNDSKPNKEISLHCIGSIHPDIDELIQENISDKLYFKSSYMEHNKVIEKMARFDYLFLVIPECEKNEGIIPGKLFEYFACGVEIILLGNLDSNAASLLRESGYTHIFNIDDKIEFKSLKPKTYPIKNAMKFNRKNQTEELSKMFDKLVS